MSKKLLLADDSVTIQRVIELTFSGEDVQVLAVGDGEEAIARIPIEKPDIVLADIGMPKRSGYEVSAFVKNNPALAHIPVLLLAGVRARGRCEGQGSALRRRAREAVRAAARHRARARADWRREGQPDAIGDPGHSPPGRAARAAAARGAAAA